MDVTSSQRVACGCVGTGVQEPIVAVYCHATDLCLFGEMPSPCDVILGARDEEQDRRKCEVSCCALYATRPAQCRKEDANCSYAGIAADHTPVPQCYYSQCGIPANYSPCTDLRLQRSR
ncbi:hypothetical protein PSPO01_03120 [Paraphaeosphaeria sporulosa]